MLLDRISNIAYCDMIRFECFLSQLFCLLWKNFPNISGQIGNRVHFDTQIVSDEKGFYCKPVWSSFKNRVITQLNHFS